MDPKITYERALALESAIEGRRRESHQFLNLLLLTLGGFGAAAVFEAPEIAIVVLTLITLVAINAFQTDAETRAMAEHSLALEKKLVGSAFTDLVIWESVVSSRGRSTMGTAVTEAKRFGAAIAPSTTGVTNLWIVITAIAAVTGLVSPVFGMKWLGDSPFWRTVLFVMVLIYEIYCLRLLYFNAKNVDHLAIKIRNHFSPDTVTDPTVASS